MLFRSSTAQPVKDNALVETVEDVILIPVTSDGASKESIATDVDNVTTDSVE